ncbi:UNKNOWN [Stylonychia lemnae]|uniref:Endonuclease/exonuclease/phosphatase domain-containing protein n=1 Tax=Stylonychia lemnae TaxID=5949 RepID=A0A078A0G4_STYLE|nr:UNKNOWN [Stylonychia lemnae]|eukprot:CDW74273.1 UNKNOWN [Stylonychia lemnae]
MKQNVYSLDADIIGLQEVVFGAEQLDELQYPEQTDDIQHQVRHNLVLEKRSEGYSAISHSVQLPIFKYNNNPDRNAKLDGNATLLCRQFLGSDLNQIEKEDCLQMSAFRNAQRIVIRLGQTARRLHFINTHLHHVIEDEHVRLEQMKSILYWVELGLQDDDIVVMVGDLNAIVGSLTYQFICQQGYTSSFLDVNGFEPKFTFPTGLQAEFMDTDPPGTFDYIFYKGRGIRPIKSVIKGDQPSENDQTIYGSDHMAVVTEFIIQP